MTVRGSGIREGYRVGKKKLFYNYGFILLSYFTFLAMVDLSFFSLLINSFHENLNESFLPFIWFSLN